MMGGEDPPGRTVSGQVVGPVGYLAGFAEWAVSSAPLLLTTTLG